MPYYSISLVGTQKLIINMILILKHVNQSLKLFVNDITYCSVFHELTMWIYTMFMQ